MTYTVADPAHDPVPARASVFQRACDCQSRAPDERLAVQPKLALGSRGDRYEQEADQIAALVTAERPSPLTGPLPVTPLIQRQAEEEEEEELLQPKSNGLGPTHVGAAAMRRAAAAVSTGGRPLPATERAYFEPRIGRDLSAVRLHDNAAAAQAAHAIGARAYTLGHNIAFAHGRYAPGTSEGRRLIAHEIVHTLQQRGAHWPHVQREEAADRRTGSSGSAPAPARAPATRRDHGPTCRPAVRGVAPSASNCSIYARNRHWLPDPYVNNATCACLTTPNSTTANCVRGYLQRRLLATPSALRRQAAHAKWASTRPLISPLAGPPYHLYVQTVLTPRIYADHVAAYRACCCPSGPASYESWIGVTTVPLPCGWVGASIRYFGSCHGTRGSW